MTCLSCGRSTSPGTRFCAACGASLKMRCPSCHHDNPLAAKVCQACHSPLRGSREGIEGDRRLVTLILATVDDPNGALEGLDPEDLLQLLDGWHRQIASILASYGGVPDRVAGSQARARFGVPFCREDDAERAVMAAWELKGTRLELPNGDRLALRLAVATGTVVFSGGAGEASLRGDVVARAESLALKAPSDSVLIDDETRRLAKSCSTSPHDDAFRVQTVGHAISGEDESLLFGRQPEVLKIEGAVLGSLRHEPQVILLSGDEGSGKTRLAVEAWRQLKFHSPKAKLLTARATSYRQEESHGLLAALLEQGLGLPPEGEEARRKALESSTTAFSPDAIPRLCQLLRLSGDTPTGGKQALYDDLVAWIHRMASTTPLILVFDDLQWADAGSLDWIDYLLRSTTDAMVPVVLVLARRGPHSCPDFPNVSRITLGALSAEEALEMVAQAFGCRDAHEAWPPLLQQAAALLIRRSEGNPLYLKELLRSLLMGGILRMTEEGWIQTRPIEQMELPSTIKGVLAARIDQLDALAKRVLGVGAAIGRQFGLELLGPIVGQPLHDTMSRLVAQKLLVPLGDSGRYAFSQALVQECAYQGLLLKDRKDIHARLATRLEQDYPERRDELAGRIARHYGQAERYADALRHAIGAWQHAQNRGAVAEAYEYLRLALDWHGKEPSAQTIISYTELLEALADAEQGAGRLDDAVTHLRQLLPLCEPPGRLKTLLALGELHERRGEFSEALECLGQALAAAREKADQARIHSVIGTIALRNGDFEEALTRAKEALSLLEGLGQPLQEAYAHSMLGVCHHRLGNWDDGLAHHRVALELREGQFDEEGIARSLNNLGSLYLDRGDWAQAKRLYVRALDIYRRLGEPLPLGAVLNNLGTVQRELGDIGLAKRHFEEAIRIFHRIGDQRNLGLAWCGLGDAFAAEGDATAAVEHLRRGVTTLERIQYRESMPEIYASLAHALMRAGDDLAAWPYLQRATFLAGESGNPVARALAMRATGEFHFRAERTDQARIQLEEALSILEKAQHRPELGRTLLALARLYEHAGDHAEASSARERASGLLGEPTAKTAANG